MDAIVDTSQEVYRPFAVLGAPNPVPHEPVKSEIVSLFGLVSAQLQALALGATFENSVLKTTKAALTADLAHPAGAWGIVIGDATAANNGLYTKSGASGSGSWTKVADIVLPAEVLADVAALETAIVSKLDNSVATTDRLLGRDTAGAGAVEEIAVSGGLEFSGALGVRIADLGVTGAKLNDLAVSTGKIQNAAVTNEKIAVNTIDATRIAPDAITSSEIAPLAVLSSKINDGAVIEAKIAIGAVTDTKIATNAVTTVKILDDAITGPKINDLAVGTTKLANDAVTGPKIAAGAVNSSEIVDGAVLSIKINDLAVTEAKIAPNAVTEAKIAAGAITAAKLAAGAVGTTTLADDAVTGPKIATGAVSSDELATGAVLQSKINDLAVSAAKLGLSAVTEEKLALHAVAEPKLASGAVSERALASGAVTSSKLGYQAITHDKIEDGAILNSKLSDMSTGHIKGRALGAGSGVPQNLNPSQVRAILGLPASGGDFEDWTDQIENIEDELEAARGTSETLQERIDRAALVDPVRHRPGEPDSIIALYTHSLANGDPAKRPPLDPAMATAVVTSEGAAVRVADASLIAARELNPVEPGHVYRIHFALLRTTLTDPAGDNVRLAIACYDASKVRLSGADATKILHDYGDELTVAAGRQTFTATVSRDPGADLVLPAACRYVRRYIELFGCGNATDIEVIGWEDITGEAVGVGLEPDAYGPLAGRSAYDAQPANFTYGATDGGALNAYIRQGAAGGWIGPFPLQGPAGSSPPAPVVDSVVAADRAALGLLDIATCPKLAFLREDGREGAFEWNPANCSAAVAVDPQQGIYVPQAAGDGSGGAWVRVVSGMHNVKWWGAPGTGAVVGADHVGVQAAITYCEWLTGTSTLVNTSGVTLFFPYGIYDTATGWTLCGDGVRLLGEGRRGSVLRTSTAGVTVLTIGDPTYAAQTYFVGVEDIGFFAAPAVADAADTTAIRCHDVLHASISNVVISNFYQGIAGYRLNMSVLDGLLFQQPNRASVKANYAIGLFSRPTDGSTAGSNKISNFDVFGGSLYPCYKDGILITSADGAYFDTGHIYYCDYDLRISPQGSDAGGNNIDEIIFDNVYFDAAKLACVRMEGSTVAAGGGVIKGGVYRHIVFDDSCTFRGGEAGGFMGTPGSDWTPNLVQLRVTAANEGVKNIKIAGHFRNAGGTAILISGTSTGFVEAETLEIDGNFSDNNRAGSATASAISAEVADAKVSGVFGEDAIAATRIVQLSGTPPHNLLIGNCDFSTVNCTSAPLSITSAVGSKVLALPNLSPLQRHMDYSAKHLHTTDATAAALFSYAMPANKVLLVDGLVLAATADGVDAGCWRVKGMFRRGPTGNTVAVVAPATTLEGESTAGLDAVLALAVNTVNLNVTGLGATLMWSFVPSVIWGN